VRSRGALHRSQLGRALGLFTVLGITTGQLAAQSKPIASRWLSFTAGLGGANMEAGPDTIYRGSGLALWRIGVGSRRAERWGIEADAIYAPSFAAADCYEPCAPPFSVTGVSAGAVVSPFGGRVAGNRSLLSAGGGVFHTVPDWAAAKSATVPGFYAGLETRMVGVRNVGIGLTSRAILLPRVQGKRAWVFTFGIGSRVYSDE